VVTSGLGMATIEKDGAAGTQDQRRGTVSESTTGGIRLSCTKAEFDKLDPAEETHFEEVWEHPAYEPDQVWCRRRTVTSSRS